MAAKEKKERAKARKWAQENGFAPLPAPRINRKKFAAEVWAMEDERPLGIDRAARAFYGSLPARSKKRITDEDMVFLRALKYAHLERDFFERHEGERVTTQQLYDEVYCKVYPKPQYKKRKEPLEVTE